MWNFARNSKLLFLSGGFLFVTLLPAGAQSQFGFIENIDQWPEDIHFVSRIPGGRMVVEAGGFRYYFLDYEKLGQLHRRSHESEPDALALDEAVKGHAVFATFDDANLSAAPLTFGRSEHYFNFYHGNDRSLWSSKVHAFDGVIYPSLYPGVDLKVYTTGESVKYDLVVSPHADPSAVRICYQGANDLHLDNGNLYIGTSLGEIIEKKPDAWQIVRGEKVPVACAFQLEGNVLSFAFPDGFDPCQELVIDPLLIFSTYSGSTADNWGSTATPGEHGNLYSAGVTEEVFNGGIFPATPGAYQTTTGGLYDIGILKYDSLGQQLLYATYLGGSNSESPHSLVVNGAEELMLLGTTSSSDYPVTANAYDGTFAGGTPAGHVVAYSAGSDIIVSRFSREGSRLLASTYFGGTMNDGLNPSSGDITRNYGDQLRGDVITDAAGNVFVSSVTASSDLFAQGTALESSYQGGATDAILLKFDPSLAELVWATYLGGTGADAAHTLKLDAAGNVFLAGGTSSADFPVTAGSYQTDYGGSVDGWIARIAADGSEILQATYTGTSQYNQIYFLDLNAENEVYVYGQTTGNFPITPGVYSDPGSGQFIQKFSADLSTLVFSTVFGSGRGIPDISPTAFLVNDCNNLFLAGWGGLINTMNGFWTMGSSTSGLSTTPDAFQSNTSGSDFYFIVFTDDVGERLYATFLGGTQSRTHVDGGTSRFDKGGIVYHSVCSGCQSYNAVDPDHATSDFPTTEGAWSRVNRSQNCNNAAFKFDLSSLKARIQTNSIKRDHPGLKVVCIPDPLIFENLSTGGEIFYWDLGDGTTFTRMDTSFVQHEYKTSGQYLVKLKAIDHGTCQVVDSTVTVVTINIADSFVQDDAAVCFGDSYELQASGASRYEWTSTDPGFSSREATPLVHPTDTTIYFIRLEEQTGCLRKDTVQLNVIPGILPEFEWSKLPDCLARPHIAVRNQTESLKAGDRIFFDFGDGSSSDQNEDAHYFEKDGVYDITLVTRREFCVYEKTVSVPVFEMFIPNVITPGKPADNDVFTIRYGEVDGVTPGDYGFNVALTIYNRWGHLVFHTDHYRYDWSGEGLAAGVYFYEVTVEGHATCKSWLHLMK